MFVDGGEVDKNFFQEGETVFQEGDRIFKIGKDHNKILYAFKCEVEEQSGCD